MLDPRVAALCSALLVSIGCGGGGGATTGKPLHSFPSRSELSDFAALRDGGKALGSDLVAVRDVEFDIPAPADNPARPLLTVATPAASPSPALDCVAHELAKIVFRAPDKRPELSVRRFISARCGALGGLYAFQTWSARASQNESDAHLVGRLRDQLKSAIDASATEAGVALVRDDERVLLLLAFGKPSVQVEPLAQVVDASGAMAIRGRVLFETDAIHAYVNAGNYGFKPCELDPAVAPPEFALRCELDPNDEAAWIQVMAVPHGHVLGREVLSMMALRRADAAKRYHREAKAQSGAQDAAALAAAALPLVNQVRERAGLGPLRAAPEQSHVAGSVAPAMFNAMLSDSESAHHIVDAISLGLLAGWDVQGGTIRTANLIGSVVVDAPDADTWLADVLEQPVGRAVLLEPDAHVLALGASEQKQPSVMCAVATTYSFFSDENKPGARAQQVLARLARVRAARGLGRTMFVNNTPGMEGELARIHSGEALPMQSLGVLIGNVATVSRRQVKGFVWETQDLDTIEFPPELLQKGDLALGAGVTYYRAPGGAWGQYVVLFLIVSPDAIKV